MAIYVIPGMQAGVNQAARKQALLTDPASSNTTGATIIAQILDILDAYGLMATA